MPHAMPRDLSAVVGLPRDQLVEALADEFPEATAGPGRSAVPDTPRGGRSAAVARLATMDPVAYARTRNHVSGAVTALSPWIRHGVLSLAEVRDAALARVTQPDDAAKLVSELGWRDYWQQVHLAVGDRIHDDLEPPAATPRREPLKSVPDDVRAGQTGLQCIDDFVRRLHDSGWLHNHERMWLASWLVHVRGVRWQAGADWFLEHLLDGDPASNHLSWQWVAGTFSAKPYIFNRENLESYTAGIHCRQCPIFGSCDVEGSYEDLAARLFGTTPGEASGEPPRPPLRITLRAAARRPEVVATRPLVWLTLDSAADTSPAAVHFPGSPRLFVVDNAWLAAERPALKRLVFLFECLAEIPGVEVIAGDQSLVVPAKAAELGCDAVAVVEPSCPRQRAASDAIAAAMPVITRPWPTFCDRSRVRDLGRFSRYWQKAGPSAMRPTTP